MRHYQDQRYASVSWRRCENDIGATRICRLENGFKGAAETPGSAAWQSNENAREGEQRRVVLADVVVPLLLSVQSQRNQWVDGTHNCDMVPVILS